jgi:hypothetical protein
MEHIVGAVVGAIVWAMHSANPTPLAKAGADVVEHCHIEQIDIVTIDQRTVIMDEASAQDVREAERRQREIPRLTDEREMPLLMAPEVRKFSLEVERGIITGSIDYAAGELHFRPDGYRYFVPVAFGRGTFQQQTLKPGRYRISGTLETQDGYPDEILVRSADPI